MTSPNQEHGPAGPTNEQVCLLGLYAVGAAFISLACQKDSALTGTSVAQANTAAAKKDLPAPPRNSDDIMAESHQDLNARGVQTQHDRNRSQPKVVTSSLKSQTFTNVPRLLRRSVEEHRIRPDSDRDTSYSVVSAGRDARNSSDLVNSAIPRSDPFSHPSRQSFLNLKASPILHEDHVAPQDCFARNINHLGIAGSRLATGTCPSPKEMTLCPPDDYLQSLSQHQHQTEWNVTPPFAASAAETAPLTRPMFATGYSHLDVPKYNRGAFNRFFSIPGRKSRADSAPFGIASDGRGAADRSSSTFKASSFRQRARSMSLDIPRLARNSVSAILPKKVDSRNISVLKSSAFGPDSPVATSNLNSNTSSAASRRDSLLQVQNLPRESQSSDSDYDGVSSAQRSDHTLDSLDSDTSGSDDDEDDIEWESPSDVSRQSSVHYRHSLPAQSDVQRPVFGGLRSTAQALQTAPSKLHHSRSSPLLLSSRLTSSHGFLSAKATKTKFGCKATELAAVYLRNVVPTNKDAGNDAYPVSGSAPILTSSVGHPSSSMPVASSLSLFEAGSPQASLKLFSDAASSTSSRSSPEWSTLEELVVTETKFLKDIQALSGVYLDGLKQMDLMAPASLDQIRSNLNELAALSKHLINTILSHVPTFSVSMQDDDLLKLSTVLARELPPRLEVFTRYCLALSGAQERLASEIQLRPAIGKYIQICKATNPNVQGMDLSQLLVLPMHRVTRLPLLFGNLARKSARKQNWNNYNTELREEDEEEEDAVGQTITDVQRCQERQDIIHRNWSQLCDASSAICKITNLAISYQEQPAPKGRRRLSMSPTKIGSTSFAPATVEQTPVPVTPSSPMLASPTAGTSTIHAAKKIDANATGHVEQKLTRSTFRRYFTGKFQALRSPAEAS